MDDREINIDPWVIISQITEYEHHTLICFVTIITEVNDNYFYLKDDIENIKDVSNMPRYIKEDWLNYNKKEISIPIINTQIKNLEKILENRRPYDPKDDESLTQLISIRRDLIINGII
jgi:hypothetical protein